MSAASDRNLVLGLLALQMDFVSREQMLDAMQAWMLARHTPLGEILCARGALAERDRSALELLVDRHVERHGGERGSLLALRIGDAVRKGLSRLGDAEIHTTIAALAPAGANGTARPTDTAGSRYRRLKPHAKGGLGEVFVAVDEELKREVALKEIQEQYAADAACRGRFVREAEVTGNLEHPGVVPVYGMGTYPDGRLYYAMRFIRGESMQEAITRFHQADAVKSRDPGERSLALRDLLTRFVSVCDAVAYAHSRGVIHRDLKPQNVMLGEYGETLVVDWGLARPVADAEGQTAAARPVATSQHSTATEQGEVLGTPSYMPPEQAHGRPADMGRYSDVFALGATLYALLTGKPPYAGDDALAQAAACDIVPPRQRNARVPRALEAVCLKALAAKPEQRYATARQLGDEVRRWLADEPVDAYPEPAVECIRRWGRRNRALVTGGVALLLASAVGLALGLWAVNREKEKAEANLGRALAAEAEATANLAQAGANLKLAKRAVDECFNVARKNPLFQEPRMERAKKLLLKATLPFYKEFRSRRPDDRGLQIEEAGQLFNLGYIEQFLGDGKAAVAAYEQAREIFARLAAAHLDVPGYQMDLARLHNNLGMVHERLGRHEEALKDYRQVLQIHARHAAALSHLPEYQNDLAVAHNNLGILLKNLGRHDEALKEYRQALKLRARLADIHPDMPQYQSDLAGTHYVLGNLHHLQDECEEALKEYNQALKVYTRLASAHPDVPQHQERLAWTHHSLGNVQHDRGSQEEGLQGYRQALTIFSRLASAHPDVPGHHSGLAETHIKLGQLYIGLSRSEEALEQYNQALKVYTRLTSAHPDVPGHQGGLAAAHNELGILQYRLRKHDEARKEFERAREIRSRLAAAHPDVPDYRNRLGGTLVNLSILQREAGKPAEALRSLAEALPHLQAAHESEPRHSTYRLYLYNAYTARARTLGQLNRHRDAVADWDRALALASPTERGQFLLARAESLARAGDHARAAAEADALGQLPQLPGSTCYNIARIQALNAASAGRDAARPLAQREKLAEEYARKAVALLHRAAAAGYFASPTNVAHLDKDADLDALHPRTDYAAFRLSLPVLEMPRAEPTPPR